MERYIPGRDFKELYSYAKKNSNKDIISAGDCICISGNGQQERTGKRNGYLKLYDGLKINQLFLGDYFSKQPDKTNFLALKLRCLDKDDKILIWHMYTEGRLKELFDFQDFKNSNGNYYPSQRWHFIVSYYDYNVAHGHKCSYLLCDELIVYVKELEQQMIKESV